MRSLTGAVVKISFFFLLGMYISGEPNISRVNLFFLIWFCVYMTVRMWLMAKKSYGDVLLFMAVAIWKYTIFFNDFPIFHHFLPRFELLSSKKNHSSTIKLFSYLSQQKERYKSLNSNLSWCRPISINLI